MFNHTQKNIGAVAAMLLAITILAFTAHAADEKNKNKKPNDPPPNAVKVYDLISGLHPSGIVNQSYKKVNGQEFRETTFFSDGFLYTLTRWDWKDKYGGSAPWVKISFHPMDSKGRSNVCSFGDAHLDGYIDVAVPSKEDTDPAFFSALGHTSESRSEQFDFTFPENQPMPETDKARQKWQKKYSALLAKLEVIAENLKSSQPPLKQAGPFRYLQAANPIATSVVQ